MIYLAICLMFALAVIAYQNWTARKERQELEDRLMSVCQPVALIQHSAIRDPSPAEITYMDEDKEYELNGQQS